MSSFRMRSWTGEDVSPRRLSRVNGCQQRLTRQQTKPEKQFARFMAGLSTRGGVLWYTPQKVFHVHAEQAFIADFYFKAFKVAVEIDGSWHSSRKTYDDWRTQVLETRRIQVIRFDNVEVEEDVLGVCRRTVEALQGTGRHARKLADELAAARLRNPTLYGRIFSD